MGFLVFLLPASSGRLGHSCLLHIVLTSFFKTRGSHFKINAEFLTKAEKSVETNIRLTFTLGYMLLV